MSTILLSDKFTKLLKEAPVSGDQGAANIAAGKQAVSDVKSRLQKMGIYDIPELKGVNTVEQLAIEPFKFKFLLQVPDIQEELSLPKPIEFDTLAKVTELEPLTLEIKTEDNSIFKMIFTNEDEIITKLPGTQKPVRALISEDSRKGKFYTISVSNGVVSAIKNEEGSEEQNKEEGDNEEKGQEGGKEKEPNYYNGKDLKEVNLKLSDIKDKAKFFTIIKQYKDDPDFQKIFLDSIINTTKSIKINQKPLLTTLKDLRSNGLLKAPEAMSGLKRKYLKIKLNLQNFMVEVFSLFAKLAKNGKQSKTFEVIKKFYKELFLIATKGKSQISDEQTRKQLWRKLLGSFSNFLGALSKLSEMTKGGKKPDEGKKEVKVKNMPKATMNTVEYYINQIANGTIILKEEDGEEEKGGEKSYEGKIYVSRIELGPKAAAKRGEDEKSYSNKVKGGKQKWDGLVNSLPSEGISADINLQLDDSNLTPEQENIFKTLKNVLKGESYKGESKIRKSKKITDNTVFVIEFGGKALVCKIAQGANLHKQTKIEIGPKAGGEDIFDKSTKALIQIN
jgi:hypothetical protein